VRHLLAAYDVSRDRLSGHIKKRKGRAEFIEFCRYVRSLYPPEVRLHFVLDKFSPHKGEQVRDWACENKGRARLRVLAEPHRGPVSATSPLTAPIIAITHPGGADPPLHRVAQPQHRQPEAPPRRQHGGRCLMLH
jgi:hypothetical protein